MKTIGKLTETHVSGKTELSGYVRTMNLNLQFRLIENPYQGSENAPDYLVVVKAQDGGDFEIGAAWKKTSAPKTIGDEEKEYLSINIDDPSMDHPLQIAAFQSNELGVWNIVWSRPKKRAPEGAA